MGQIIGGAAKPKRCNANQLSQVPTPAAGEHILVSSDNSMNAAGHGNFDCYIVGDGTTAATALPLRSLADLTPTENSKNAVSSGGVYEELHGLNQNYIEGFYYKSTGEMVANSSWAVQADYIPFNLGDTIEWKAGATNSSACLILYKADKSFAGYYGTSANPRTITAPNSGDYAYLRISFYETSIADVYIKINGTIVWTPNGDKRGLWRDVNGIESVIGYNIPLSPASVTPVFSAGYVKWANGSLNTTSSINSKSDPILCTGFTKLRFVGSRYDHSADEGAAFYDANNTYISGISYYDLSYSGSNTYKTYEVDIPANAKFFRFTLLNTFLQYASVEFVVDNIKNNINEINEKLDAITTDALSWIDGYQIYTNEGVGNTCAYNTFASASFRCIKGECVAGQKILITAGSGGNSPRLWCFLDASNKILSVADANATADNLEVTAPTGAKYFVLNDTLKAGNAYLYTTQPINVKLEMLSGDNIEKPLRVSNCRSFGTQPAANGTTGSFCDIKNGTYNDLLTAVYEPLRAQFPNYITRTNIGKDASNTIDMYAYVFEPRYWQQSIYLQAGIHGKEVDAVACLARIMYLIANSDGTNEDLEFLRQKVKITIVPCVNVWGISQSPKNNNNSNNVALQDWSNATPPAEIANVKAYIANNLLVDELSFMLDMHTTTNDTYYDFYGNIQKYAKNVRAIFRTNAWLCDKYALDGRTVDDQYLGYYEPANRPLFRQYYYYTMGVQTATLELSDYHWSNALSTSDAITMGVTMWLNYIIQMVNDGYVIPEGIPEEDYRQSRG